MRNAFRTSITLIDMRIIQLHMLYRQHTRRPRCSTNPTLCVILFPQRFLLLFPILHILWCFVCNFRFIYGLQELQRVWKQAEQCKQFWTWLASKISSLRYWLSEFIMIPFFSRLFLLAKVDLRSRHRGLGKGFKVAHWTSHISVWGGICAAQDWILGPPLEARLNTC